MEIDIKVLGKIKILQRYFKAKTIYFLNLSYIFIFVIAFHSIE